MKLYCLWDKDAEEGGALFEARNDNMARRIYNGLKEFPEGTSREDFKLMKLGSYFHGNEKDKPHIYAMSMPIDITKPLTGENMFDEEQTVEKEPWEEKIDEAV